MQLEDPNEREAVEWMQSVVDDKKLASASRVRPAQRGERRWQRHPRTVERHAARARPLAGRFGAPHACRMGPQPLDPVARPRQALECLEELDRPADVAVLLGHDPHRLVVGLAFLVPAERPHRQVARVAERGTGGVTGHHAQQQPHRESAAHRCRGVTVGEVRDLVRHHRGQRVLAVEPLDQAAVHAREAAERGERVHCVGEHNRRGGKKEPFEPADARRYSVRAGPSAPTRAWKTSSACATSERRW